MWERTAYSSWRVVALPVVPQQNAVLSSRKIRPACPHQHILDTVGVVRFRILVSDRLRFCFLSLGQLRLLSLALLLLLRVVCTNFQSHVQMLLCQIVESVVEIWILKHERKQEHAIVAN